MAGENKYNMADLFATAFGVGNVPVFYPGIKEGKQENPQLTFNTKSENENAPAFDYSDLRVVSNDFTKGKSWLGTPINFKFSLKGGKYNCYEAGQIIQKEVADFQFPLTTMVDISRAKRDTVTPTAAGNGTVKELYAFEDWKIRIRGICLYDPGHPQAPDAREQRNKIAEFENLADSIALLEDDGLFTDLGIYRLYIHEVNFPQIPMKPNMLAFELSCLSDEDIILIQ